MTTARKPIEYVGFIDVRFSDLDPYGHVNAKHYIDYVASVRLTFMANKFGITVDEIVKRGVGFYLSKSTVNYRKGINGLQKVKATSFVESIRSNCVLVIPFKITSEDGSVVFSDGVLEYAIVDLSVQKVTKAPEWLSDLFYQTLP